MTQFSNLLNPEIKDNFISLESSEDFNKYLTIINRNPFLIGISRGGAVACVYYERYSDLIEPTFKGTKRVIYSYQFERVGKTWNIIPRNWNQPFNVVEPNGFDFEKQLLNYSLNGWSYKVNETNTLEELKEACEGVYTTIEIEDFYYSSINEKFKISIFCQGTVRPSAYEFEVDELAILNVLERAGVISYYDDECIEDGEFEYESLAQFWAERKDDCINMKVISLLLS